MLIAHHNRWQALARAFAKNRIPQTLLLSGPAHIGKTTLLIRYAQLLLCQNLQTDAENLPAPCGVCKICHQVAIETFPDFRVYRPIVSSEKQEKDEVTAPEAMESSMIPVGMARRIGEEAMSRPVTGERKVLAIAQVERMNDEAQNALLKTFEEPGRGISIVLLAENPAHLLRTVLSRAWHLPLTLAPATELRQWLQSEFAGAQSAHLEAAIAAAAGRPGKAWRQMKRLSEGETARPRFEVTNEILGRIETATPVGALGLTESATKWAKAWWEEDTEGFDTKKGAAKATRAGLARFLDELALAGRARWLATAQSDSDKRAGTLRLDQIRKTRHYILGNANANLALDVMFGRLIALRSSPVENTFSQRPRR